MGLALSPQHKGLVVATPPNAIADLPKARPRRLAAMLKSIQFTA
jgi:hypothetical protein